MYPKNYIITAFFLLSLCKVSLGQLFTKVVPTDVVDVYSSHNAWIDFDNDGDLDFLVTGQISTNLLSTKLYENKGNDSFRPASAAAGNFPDYSESEINFLNTNKDDRIDVILMGRQIGSAATQRISIMENRTGGFTDVGPLPDFGAAQGSGTISVGDVDNNGTSDIFICGINGYVNGNPSLVAYLYLNQNKAFVKSATSFDGLYLANSKLADLDNDQDLDLVLSGSTAAPPYQSTTIYLNDGSGNFQKTPSQLSNLQNSSTDVADYDGDNDLDILLTGIDQFYNYVTKLYKNTNGVFTAVPLPNEMNRTAGGSAKWGDFDNDGDFDILITGRGGANSKKMAIFKNNGADLFEEIAEQNFVALSEGYTSWGDYDSDGDLDILATGSKYSVSDDFIPTLVILKNETLAKNTRPNKPSNFKIVPTNFDACNLEWSSSTDDFTPDPSITYNLSIRNSNTGEYIQHPNSDNITGKRRVNEHGNLYLNKTWKIRALADGTYAMKVQGIDGGFLGSEWSTEKFFYAGVPSPPTNLNLVFNEGKIKLTWTDNSINEEYFVIERRTNGGSFIKLDSTTSNVATYNDPYTGFNLYEYRVCAVNPNQRSASSNSAKTAIEAPTGLTGTFVDGKVKLIWIDNSYNEEFFVLERSTNGGSFIKLDSTTSNTTTYSDPYSGFNLYEYRIRAVNPNQRSSYSITFRTNVETPIDLIAAFVDGKVKLTWTDKSYNEEFIVIERKLGGGNFAKIDSVTTNKTVYEEPFLENGFYSYRIYASNRHQKSSYSNTAEILVTHLEADVNLEATHYPNPATDLLIVKSKSSKNLPCVAEIITLSGAVILTTSSIFNNNGEARFDVGSIPAGLFIARLKTSSEPLRIIKFLKN